MRSLFAVTALLVAACGAGDSTGPDPIPTPVVPSYSMIMHSPPDTVQPGDLINVTASVMVNQAGVQSVASDMLVNFVVLAGGGSVFAPAVQTNAQGQAFQRWTVGSDGWNILEARAISDDGDAVVVARDSVFVVTPIPPAPLELVVSPGVVRSSADLPHTFDELGLFVELVDPNQGTRTPVTDYVLEAFVQAPHTGSCVIDNASRSLECNGEPTRSR